MISIGMWLHSSKFGSFVIKYIANWKPKKPARKIQPTLFEEIDERAIATYIKVLLHAFAFFETQLRHIIASIVPEQHPSARFQITITIVDHIAHSVEFQCSKFALILDSIGQNDSKCNTERIHFSGLIADRTKISTMRSMEFSANGTHSDHFSLVASNTNTWHRFASNSSCARKISMALDEKSQPNTRKFSSALYFKIGKMVLPTPQPISKML